MVMGLLRPKGNRLVGLDVGSAALKMVSLQAAGRGGYQVETAATAPLPSGSIVDGVIAKPDAVGDAIREMFESNGIKETKVATSVSGHAVIVKKISLPATTPQEVKESIQWEAEQYIPFDIADVYLDYHLLGPSASGKESEVILVAAKRETIDSHGDIIMMSGKNPVIMDIDAFALHNAYEVNYEPRDESVVALLNIGASIMNVNIATGRNFVFTRDIGMGGNYYTEYIQRDLGVSYEDAEQYKQGGAPEELRLTVSSVIQSVSEILALEVQKTFDYFRTASEFDELQNIYISGGASRTEGLREYLQETFQVPVNYLNPFERVRVNGASLSGRGEDQGAEYAVAVGLALRSPGDKVQVEGGKGGRSNPVTALLQKLTRR